MGVYQYVDEMIAQRPRKKAFRIMFLGGTRLLFALSRPHTDLIRSATHAEGKDGTPIVVEASYLNWRRKAKPAIPAENNDFVGNPSGGFQGQVWPGERVMRWRLEALLGRVFQANRSP
jgi:hypothetical protein